MIFEVIKNIVLGTLTIISILALIGIIVALVLWIKQLVKDLANTEEKEKLQNEIQELKEKIYRQQKELERLYRNEHKNEGS